MGFSNTDRADKVDDTSNCGINGRWNVALLKGNLHKPQVTGPNVTLQPIKPGVDISTGHQGTHQAMISGSDHPMLDNTVVTVDPEINFTGAQVPWMQSTLCANNGKLLKLVSKSQMANVMDLERVPTAFPQTSKL